MHKLRIEGGIPINGEIKSSGSKNSSLPILFASIISDSASSICGVPHLEDVSTTLNILTSMGAKFILEADNCIYLDSSNLTNFKAEYHLVKTMRASILVLGPLLAKYGKAEVSMPGGCAIGTRPVNIHIDGLSALGANIKVEEGYIKAKAKKLKGAHITLDINSVTATENIMMAATLAKGETVINNAAKEPEVTDLANFLIKMGAKITGLGSSVLKIKGVKKLHGVDYKILPDRIEGATYLAAAALTKGKMTLKNTKPEMMQASLDKLTETGADIKVYSNAVVLNMHNKQPKAVNIKTTVYPGFATDMQAQFVALNCVAKGKSTITETIFENRFMHIAELKRLGANLELNGNTVVCEGKKELIGAQLMATDLRASASLVLAGLAAKGTTTIDRVYHLDRGYEAIEEKLKMLGANIERIRD